jgi:hypothetical protein
MCNTVAALYDDIEILVAGWSSASCLISLKPNALSAASEWSANDVAEWLTAPSKKQNAIGDLVCLIIVLPACGVVSELVQILSCCVSHYPMNFVAVELNAKRILIGISNVVLDTDDDLNDVTIPKELIAKRWHAILIGAIRGTDVHKMPGIRMTIEVWEGRDGVPGGLLVGVRRIAVNRCIRTFGVRKATTKIKEQRDKDRAARRRNLKKHH